MTFQEKEEQRYAQIGLFCEYEQIYGEARGLGSTNKNSLCNMQLSKELLLLVPFPV